MTDPARPDGLSDDLVDRAASLVREDRRALLGIAGAPASGKTTLAAALVERLLHRDVAARVVPMDGFHLADATLDRLGRRDRKGAPDTFDGHGYAALLRRLRIERAHVVYAPGFERTIEQPLAGAIAVEPSDVLIVTEGNYLLVDTPPWDTVRAQLDEVWFCSLDSDVRQQRLLVRHVRFGKSRDEAARWIACVDAPNAALVASTRVTADLVVESPRS